MAPQLDGPLLSHQEIVDGFVNSAHPRALPVPELTRSALQCVYWSLRNERRSAGLEPLEVEEQREEMGELFADRLAGWRGPDEPLGTGYQAALALWVISTLDPTIGEHPLAYELQRGLLALAEGRPWDADVTVRVDVSARSSAKIGTVVDERFLVEYASPEAQRRFEGLYGEDLPEQLAGWRLPGRPVDDSTRNVNSVLLAAATSLNAGVDLEEFHRGVAKIFGFRSGVISAAVYAVHQSQGMERTVDFVCDLDERVREVIRHEIERGPLLSPLDLPTDDALLAPTAAELGLEP